MPAGVVPHYQQCLLVWCLTIGFTLTIGKAFWYVATATNILLVQCRWTVTSLVLALLPVHKCHYIRHVCGSGAILRYACLYSATLSSLHAGFIYSDMRVCKMLLHQAQHLDCYNTSDKPIGIVPLLRLCKTSWSPTILDAILNLSNSELNMNSITWMLQGLCLYVIQESEQLAFCRHSLREDFPLFFVIICHLVCISISFLFGYKLSAFN